MRRAFLLGLVSMVSLPLAAQTPTEPPPKGAVVPAPLEVTVTPAQRQVVDIKTHSTVWAPAVDLTVKNVTGRCVIAYSLILVFKDSEGNRVASGGETRFRHQKAQFVCLQPGQTLASEGDPTRLPLDPSGNAATTTDVAVDFVIFGDGSTWGPGTDAEQRGYLLGQYRAYKQMQKDE